MIIELSNGLDHLYQWDTGQKVKVPGDIPTVHFKWGNDAVSFDVVDGWVEIPPELTQKAGYILLWTYKEDHTLDAARIPVERRPKPAGYAYTPTEVKTWEALDKRIEALEAANVQPNWDQNDDSAADYVRGRTHYVGSKHDVRIINQNEGPITPDLGLIVGNSYRVWYDAGNGFGGDTAAEEFVCQTLSVGEGARPNPYAGKPYVGNADANGGPNPYLIFDNGIVLHTGFDHVVNPKSWKIEGDFADIKTLDSKYLDPTLLERIQALEDGGGVAGVSSVNGQTGAVTITAEGLGALTEGNLQSATNAALAQAKASGEFDGAPGAPGTPGAPGADGHSPTVTVEQTDTGATITATDKSGTTAATIKNGSAGDPGADGITPHIGDNGNWYLGDTDTGKPSQGPAGAGLDVTGATVGQTVKISAVDSNGVPTAWEPVDMVSGGSTWEKLYDGTMQIEQETMAIEVDMPRNDSAKGFQIYLRIAKNVAQEWAAGKNISVKINGASCGYFTFIDKLVSDFYVFAKREFDAVGRIEYATAAVSPNYNRLNMLVQLANGSGYGQKNDGKISISLASPYAGSIELLVYGRY